MKEGTVVREKHSGEVLENSSLAPNTLIGFILVCSTKCS